jgi:hypothetical protein
MEISELILPPHVKPIEIAGEGRRSITYRADAGGEIVALKVYRQEFIVKYQQRYKINIAQFEIDRNQQFCDIESLRPYAARPIEILGIDDGYSLCFLQEYIIGHTLVELADMKHGLPQSVLDAGGYICQAAEAAGMHDLDIFYKNVMVRKRGDTWLPVLHDFNMIPQHMHPPNPFLALAYLTGIRRKSHRDWRCLKGWQAYSDQQKRQQ